MLESDSKFADLEKKTLGNHLVWSIIVYTRITSFSRYFFCWSSILIMTNCHLRKYCIIMIDLYICNICFMEICFVTWSCLSLCKLRFWKPRNWFWCGLFNSISRGRLIRITSIFTLNLTRGSPRAEVSSTYYYIKIPPVPSVSPAVRYLVWTVPAALADSWPGIGPRL